MTPRYTRGSINRVGKLLVTDNISPQERDEALDELNDWRSLHLDPMNMFQATLRGYVERIDPKHGIVAQRLKRTPTIIDKLKNRQQVMKLGEMQDIGGLRAIVSDVAKVRELEKKYDRSRARHVLRRKRDYIAQPQESGYRGIHLVYSCVTPKNSDTDGLLVEIQLRTHLQHLWATAVETVGTFFQESLKSSQGSRKWLEFFKQISAIFAIEEGERPHEAFRDVPYGELLKRLKEYTDEHAIFATFKLILAATQVLHPKVAKPASKQGPAAYWIIESYVKRPHVKIYNFYKGQEDTANAMYRNLEDRCGTQETQIVLISVDSFRKIAKAYPNFFSNIADFHRELHRLYHAAT